MIDFNDDLINKYLDGELDTETSAKVEKFLNENESARRKFSSLRLLHNLLHKINEDHPSDKFTQKVMYSISRKKKADTKQKYFILTVALFIILLCLMIFGYGLTEIISTSDKVINPESFNTLNDITEEFVSGFLKVFSGHNLSIIGSILSFGLIIAGYIFFEKQKHTKAFFNR